MRRLLCIFLLLALPCLAAEKYVVKGGTGLANGSSWDNACDTFGLSTSATGCKFANVSAGDTVYFGTSGSGNYGNLPISKGITVKGATTADHGAGANWLNTYSVLVSDGGGGPAIFNAFTITSSSVTIEGNTCGAIAGKQVTASTVFGIRSDDTIAYPAAGFGGTYIGGAYSNVSVHCVDIKGSGRGGNQGSFLELDTVANSGATCNAGGNGATFKFSATQYKQGGASVAPAGPIWLVGTPVQVWMGTAADTSFNGTGTVTANSGNTITISYTSGGCTPNAVSGSTASCNLGANLGASGNPTGSITAGFTVTDKVNCSLVSGTQATSSETLARAASGGSNLSWDQVWMHDSNNSTFILRSVNTYSITNSLIERNTSNIAQHANCLTDNNSRNVTFSNNRCKDIEGTGGWTVLTSGAYNSAVTSISCNGAGNTVTLNHALPTSGSYTVGMTFYVYGVTDTSFNSSNPNTGFSIATVPSSTQVTYAATCTPNASSSGGILAVRWEDSVTISGVTYETSNGNPYYINGYSQGVVDIINGELVTNLTVNNLTVANLTCGFASCDVGVNYENNAFGTATVKNNLWYNNSTNSVGVRSLNTPAPGMTFTEGYNTVYNNSGTVYLSNGVNNDQVNGAATNPFNGSTTGDFTLTAGGAAALSAGAPISFTDGAGGSNPGANGIFYRGAYVYGSSPLPVITSFTATPNNSVPSTLAWTTSQCTSASLDNGIGAVGCNSNTSVSPSVTTTYNLTATNAQGSVSQPVTVTISVIASLSFSPPVVNFGRSTTMSWSSSGTTTCQVIDPNGNSVGSGTSGTLVGVVGVVFVPGTYTETCSPSGSSTATLTAVGFTGIGGSFGAGGPISSNQNNDIPLQEILPKAKRVQHLNVAAVLDSVADAAEREWSIDSLNNAPSYTGMDVVHRVDHQQAINFSLNFCNIPYNEHSFAADAMGLLHGVSGNVHAEIRSLPSILIESFCENAAAASKIQNRAAVGNIVANEL